LATSREGYYTVAITTSTATCPAVSCYELTATPTTKGNQNNDATCKSITLNSQGVKGTSGCW
jgi:Tfp pilus assembly protein PilE